MSRARTVTRKSARAKPPVAVARPPEMAEPTAPEALKPAPATAAQFVSAPPGLKLEASCTVRDAMDMQFQLLSVDFGDSDVVVDGSAVERIDTAGLQLLLSFVKHQASRGKAVQWVASSPELIRGSQLLGIAGLLGLPESTSGSEARGN
jgi:phospholipid transport system transporter-binding protein